MTVEELIERLKQFDPKLPVTICSPKTLDWYEIAEAQVVPLGADVFEFLTEKDRTHSEEPHVRIG